MGKPSFFFLLQARSALVHLWQKSLNLTGVVANLQGEVEIKLGTLEANLQPHLAKYNSVTGTTKIMRKIHIVLLIHIYYTFIK